MMSKFKKGDRVVVVSEKELVAEENGLRKGDSFTIEEHFGPDSGTWHFDIYYKEGCEIPYSDDELELEDVYNSPLYQALK